MSERIQELNADNFKSTVASAEQPVLVDFWAPWCGPCKAIAPILEELAQEMDGKVKICKLNIDDHGEVAADHNVRAIPTLLLFHGGKVVEQIVGMTGKEDLKNRISAHV